MNPTNSISKNPLGFEKLSYFQTQKSHPQFCIGIDPPLNSANPFFQHALAKEGIFNFLKNYSHSLLEICGASASSVKFQSAFFEAWGVDGLLALKEAIQYAKQMSLFTILDAKRGDISSTMQAYGKTCFENFNADCMTILPYMGEDSVEAIIPWLRQGKTCYVVLVSSNPSGKNLQNIKTESNLYVWEDFFLKIHSFANNYCLEKNLGFVIGAEQSLKVLEESKVSYELQKYPWLIPGVGAQGTSMSELSKTLNSNPLHIAPISRALTDSSSYVSDLKNWGDFRDLIQKNTKHLFT